MSAQAAPVTTTVARYSMLPIGVVLVAIACVAVIVGAVCELIADVCDRGLDWMVGDCE